MLPTTADLLERLASAAGRVALKLRQQAEEKSPVLAANLPLLVCVAKGHDPIQVWPEDWTGVLNINGKIVQSRESLMGGTDMKGKSVRHEPVAGATGFDIFPNVWSLQACKRCGLAYFMETKP